MDNLTHSLVGAVLGQAGLKRRTGLAMPALIIGANIPDIDAACVIYGPENLAMRRGITHGPIAMVLLPLVLAGLLYAYDRWQAKRGKRPDKRLPVHFGWLLALSYIGCLSHPALDWLNTYGIRLLEPFSHRWFYGDAIYIIDIWLWLGLGIATWLSLRRERQEFRNWRRPARVALLGALAYIGFNIGYSNLLEWRVRTDAPYPRIAVASPVPVTFWKREVLWRNENGDFGMIPCTLTICDRSDSQIGNANMDDPSIVRLAGGNADAEAFLFWSRMPVAQEQSDGSLVLMDQRFWGFMARGSFRIPLTPEDEVAD